MAENQVLVGLDIGSNSVRIAVGNPVGEKTVNVIGLAEVESEGINRGVVTSIEEAMKSINTCREKVEKIVGFPLESAWVGITGGDIISQSSRGMVTVSNPEGEIKEEDIARVKEAAQMVTGPANYDILHTLPINYYIDGQKNKDPLGMKGLRLEVDAYLIQALSSQIRNLTKSIYQTGLDIEDIVFSVLACAEAVLTTRQRDLGVAVLNIGGAISSLAVYEEGQLLHMSFLPIGAEHITSDIAIGLRTSIDVAEKIKLNYGQALAEGIDAKEEINLNEFDPQEDSLISRKYLAEIIEARVEEIFQKVNKDLKQINRNGMLPSGVVLTGGGAKLKGLVEAAKNQLQMPASLGYALDVSSPFEDINDLSYSTAIGLLKWGNSVNKGKGDRSRNSRFSSVDNASAKIKKWFKNLLP